MVDTFPMIERVLFRCIGSLLSRVKEEEGRGKGRVRVRKRLQNKSYINNHFASSSVKRIIVAGGEKNAQ